MQVIPLVGAAAAVMVTADEDTVEPAADVLYKHRIINCQDILLNLTFNENKYLLTAAISRILSCWVRTIKDLCRQNVFIVLLSGRPRDRL